MKILPLLTLTLVLILPALSTADRIILKNGNEMTGTITHLDQNNITIETGYGPLTIPRRDLQSAVIGEQNSARTASAEGSRAEMGLSEGLVAEYLLNGDAKDTSGKEHNGVVQGNPQWISDRFGRQGQAAAFKSNNADFIKVADNPDLDGRALTLSVWVNGNSPQLWARIIDKYNYVSKKGYALIYNHKKQTIAFDAWAAERTRIWVETATKLQKRWQHICLTYDGKTAQIYYDGKLEGTVENPKPLAHTDQILTIGSGYDGSNHFPWSGGIDDVRIYNRALSEKEVRTLFTDGAGGEPTHDLSQEDGI